ncbi:unnamed protein product, partial [Prorocentrum cordatum]
ALHQMRQTKHDYDTELAVLDFKDAFFLMPLHASERKFFVLKFRGRFLVFMVTPQGMYEPRSLLLSVHVDDPCMAVTGTKADRDLRIAAIAVLWNALGFPLSYRKAARGMEVTWVGRTFALSREMVALRVKRAILEDLESQVGQALASNVCSRKLLRSLTGRASHVASVIWPLRPFLQQLWAALAAGASGAPPQCVWTRQIEGSLLWLRAFLSGAAGTLVRKFVLADFFNEGVLVSITLDASPWGLGAILEEAGRVVEWYAVPLDGYDVAVHGFQLGDAAGQQTWETLNALVALRCWAPRWSNRRVSLYVRGDSVTMLTMLLSFRPATRSGSLGLIAREVALDVASAVYGPDVVEHVPGLANVAADTLSRRFAPDAAAWSPPLLVAGASEVRPPPRTEAFYTTVKGAAAYAAAGKPGGEVRQDHVPASRVWQ